MTNIGSPTKLPFWPIPAPEPEPEPEPPPPPARLVIAAAWNPATQVRVGGRRIHLEREQRIELPAGRHTLTFTLETPAYRFEKSLQVRVVAGETARIATPIERPGQLTVQPHLGSRPGVVRIDGQAAGSAPLRGHWLAPGDYRVEVFAAGAATPSLSQSVAVRGDFESVVTFDVDGAQPTQVRERPLAGN
ncbi:MAG: hypothetical protein K8I65_16135 [Thermoanaerobaculia bacterium]|nr:hypothetical protein [Thermoanaerobaculia bacterium]